MKALVRYEDEAKAWRVEDIPAPNCGPDEVKIKVAYAGICGSDLHMYHGVFIVPGKFVSGHEFSGTIAEIGKDVEGFTLGERVTVEHTYSTCGVCKACRRGSYQLCKERKSIGFDKNGAFAEYVLVRPEYIHRLPENVSLKEAALSEPLACAVHAVEMVKPEPSDKVLVVGPGPIGLLTALTFKAHNSEVDIIGTPSDAMRLAKAKEMGINVVEKAEEDGYTIVAECSGSSGGMNLALSSIERGGKYLQVGIAGKPVTLDFDNPLYKELTIYGTYCHNYPSWEKTIDFMAKELIDVKPIISKVIKLEEWEQAIELLDAQQALKILIGFEEQNNEK